MVQSAVLDPTAALLAFSKSFKKVRRAETALPIRYVKRKENIDEIPPLLPKYTKPRSTSLPNPGDLYTVVRDNGKRLLARKISNLEEMDDKRKYGRQKYRFNSLLTTIPLSHSAPFDLINDNLAKEFLGSYVRTNGSIANNGSNIADNNTIKLLKSTLMYKKGKNTCSAL
uniref:Uncharacterized protein n=1 Tax=Elaeophora elaphi TaxID=1147741 RepID=A0A0R3RME7_9BILA